MGQNKRASFGPIAVPTSPTNLLNPGTVTGGVNCIDTHYNSIRMWITRIRILNQTSSDKVVSLWIGSTGASATGTEFLVKDSVVPANDGIEFQPMRMLDTAQFLVMDADAGGLTIEGDYEIGLA